MGAVSVYYADEHDDQPVTVTTPDEVDALIDRVRDESPEQAPILMQLYIADDVYAQELSAGIRGDRGVLRYSGRNWPEGVYSTGDGPIGPEPLAYFYMDNHTEFPPNAEVPLATVRQAVRDFLTTSGDRPSGVDWQPEQ